MPESSIEETEQVLYKACAGMKPRQFVSVLASDLVAVIDNLRDKAGQPSPSKVGDDE